MAERNGESAAGEEEINRVDTAPKVEEAENFSQGDSEEVNVNRVGTAPRVEEAENFSQGDSEEVNVGDENQMPSQKQEEEIIRKKYCGLLQKKPPLISKDHERAFFDSADWALGKAGAQKSKGPLEALRPKLQPTPHQQVRSRSHYAPAGEGEDDCKSDERSPGENEESTSDVVIECCESCPDNQNQQS